jgi:ABC-type transport system involved in multi-copper enzyme maturation permease subunit
VIGLARAEWLRFRKRRSLLVIVAAVPLLVGFFFVVGYASIWGGPPPFDAEATRARLIADGMVIGLPPAQAEELLVQYIESERVNTQLQLEQLALQRATYAFPQSLVTVLGNGPFVYFALILLTATTIGDEFGWGTIRTALLASSHRRRMLLVRLAALGVIAGLLLVLLLIAGTALPVVLAAAGANLPSAPPVDGGALLVLILGELVVGLAVVGFAALATLVMRSGSLTLVATLVYFAVEAAILVLLSRFEPFRQDGAAAWVLDTFPIHGITTLTTEASRAASAFAHNFGEVFRPNLGATGVPILAMAVWGTVFALLAFRRFSRMDIAE